ncbi:MAG: hypothetical protein ACYDB1_11990 [Acidiferrobacteraceae bacterium]
MVKIEISILDCPCPGRRLTDQAAVWRKTNTWQRQRNTERHRIEWAFARPDADRKLRHHHVSSLMHLDAGECKDRFKIMTTRRHHEAATINLPGRGEFRFINRRIDKLR